MTYICGYILVLLFVPLVAPRLMGVNLKEEAAKLEAALSGGAPAKPSNLLYRKFQARAYQVSAAAGRTVGEIEAQIGRRAVVERILRGGEDVELQPDTRLQAGDEILLAGPSAAIVAAAPHDRPGDRRRARHAFGAGRGARGVRNRPRSAWPDIGRNCRPGRRHGARRIPARLDAPRAGGADDARERGSMSATS